jgi:RimJ/RimL family protein N-acetyltransferase
MNGKAPEHIETQRLILERPRMTDARAIFERYGSDAEVARFLSWPKHRSIEDTHKFLQSSDLEWNHRPAGPYLIRLRPDGLLLGSTGLAFEADSPGKACSSATRSSQTCRRGRF